MADMRPLPSKVREAQSDAQELVCQAWETPNRKKRSDMASEALKLWPDCADAWSLLAQEARTPEEALETYQKAVAAGERALGAQAFKDDVGFFWGLLETRPYMRARASLAQALEDLDRYEEAIAHYRELLKLNPGDNQGIRYLLLHALIASDRNDEAWTFVNESPTEIMAMWLYPKALLAFRRDGRSSETDRLLREAIGRNRFVPDYLLGRKRTSRTLPDYVGIGDEDEAAVFVSEYALVWHKTPGAAEWLRMVAR
ncbi:MAG TPA: tetratricopeptide repeat protein [Gammaproteobacteria bacterium]|nr:tetratricopeptide repeat protein [Gammaproteobacteria bacterium]